MTQQPPPPRDPVTDTVSELFVVAVGALTVLLLLPLAVPAAVLAFVGPLAATRASYWVVPRGWRWFVGAGISAVLVLVGIELALLVGWIGDNRAVFEQPLTQWLPVLWAAVWPWLLTNLLAGVLLVPVAIAVRRRRLARQVARRAVRDVLLQERIEAARARAAAWTASRRMGVTVDVRTGQITGSDGTVSAPYPVGGGQAFGFVSVAPDPDPLSFATRGTPVDADSRTSSASGRRPGTPCSASTRAGKAAAAGGSAARPTRPPAAAGSQDS